MGESVQPRRPWEAAHALSAGAVLALVQRRCPDAGVVSLRWEGRGWDNDVWVSQDGRWAFRVPRRALALALLERERAVLPALLPHLPLPGPLPVWYGPADDAFDASILGVTYLPGTTACRATLTPAQRAAHALPLAALLRTLHALPAALVADPPRDDHQRASVSKRRAWLAERIAAIGALGLLQGAPGWAARVDALAAQVHDHDGPLRWVHGDLYARHLLVDGPGALCGVIDWGDVHLGDPALDLAIVTCHLPLHAHAAFWEAYGDDPDGPLARRALLLGWRYIVSLWEYGADVGDEAMIAAAKQALHTSDAVMQRWGV